MQNQSIAGAIWSAGGRILLSLGYCLSGLMVITAVALCPLHPVWATTFDETISGTVASGTDTTGVFGAPNSNLAGDPFSLLYSIDDTKGDQYVSYNPFGVPDGSFVGSGNSTTNPITAVLTINGVSFTYGLLPSSSISSGVTVNNAEGPQRGSYVVENYGVNNALGYSIGGSNVSTVVAFVNPPYTPSYDWAAPLSYDIGPNVHPPGCLICYDSLGSFSVNAGDLNTATGTVYDSLIASGTLTLTHITVGTPSTSGPTLFNPAIKAIYGNVKGATDLLTNALSVGTFTFQNIRDVTFNALDYIGLALGTPDAAKIFTTQVLATANLDLAINAAVGACATVEASKYGKVLCGLGLVNLFATVVNAIADVINKDPPDPDYQTAFVPTISPSPIPLMGPCSDLDSASQTAPYSLAQVIGWEDALYITNNRYQTAFSAGDIASANLQSATFQDYLGFYESAAQTASFDLTCLANMLAASGLGTELPTTQEEYDALNILQTLDTSSVSDILTPFGFTSADIAMFIAAAASNPPLLPTVTPVSALNNLAQTLTPTSAPEPGSLSLFLAGVLMLLVVNAPGRRRRSAFSNSA